MTVAELIEWLKKQPEDAPVWHHVWVEGDSEACQKLRWRHVTFDDRYPAVVIFTP